MTISSAAQEPILRIESSKIERPAADTWRASASVDKMPADSVFLFLKVTIAGADFKGEGSGLLVAFPCALYLQCVEPPAKAARRQGESSVFPEWPRTGDMSARDSGAIEGDFKRAQSIRPAADFEFEE